MRMMKDLGIRTEETAQMTLKEECVLYGGLSLLYRLIAERRRKQTRFFVSVELNGERAGSYLGDDLLRAWDTYSKLVRGAVTPCSLQEVLSDLKVV
ncbi:MAG: hypothetical protein IJX28_07560 [Clostridia bacterium]|nr:hypothetical protein [Clostridia bacterium]